MRLRGLMQSHTPLRRILTGLGVLLAGLPGLLLAQGPPDFAVTGATIHSLQPDAPVLQGGVIVVQGGKITCLGVLKPLEGATHPLQRKVCTVPAGVVVHGMPGMILIPGLIESLGRLGQVEVDAEEASHDGIAARESNLAHVQAIDGVQVHARAVEAARRGGVTTVVARPMGGALITGQSVAFRTMGDVVDDVLVRNPVAIHVTLGEEAKVDQPLVGARSGQVALLRTLLERARRIADADAGKKPKEVQGKDSLQRLRDDPGLVALAQVLAHKLPLVVHAMRADDISAALRLREQFGFELVIAGGAEAHVVADRLAAAKVPVLLGPVRQKPYDFSTARATVAAAAILHAAGVTVGLATAETHGARNLRWEAGFAVAAGLPWDVALAGVTRTVAEILHLGPGIGQLREGTLADFAVYDGDPLGLQGHVRFVSAGGVADPAPVQR
jgi:imidazolonepropionase-like amidohydrolase